MLKALGCAILATTLPLALASGTEVSHPEPDSGAQSRSLAEPRWPIADASRAPQALEPLDDDGRGTDYIVERTDNICGLGDPRQLTRPAWVDHAKLIALTPQMQLMKREKINPNSARGIHLRTEAAKVVSNACEQVRADKQFCSVWKKIRRRDGKKIADITALVKRELEG